MNLISRLLRYLRELKTDYTAAYAYRFDPPTTGIKPSPPLVSITSQRFPAQPSEVDTWTPPTSDPYWLAYCATLSEEDE